ncbi:MAG TPA: hypothetical protein VEL11_18610 [Candidatus Bathyarchaeia archaeon]|nr:hypothetical protein [Candidatus Bathyarchaeia archaeon]
MTYLLLTAADSDKAQAYATLQKNTISALTTKFTSRTSDDILAKVLIDEAIQALQNGNRTTAIKYLIAANQELNSGLENPSSAIEPSFIVEYLVQLMQTGTNSITNNKALVYLNLVDSQLGCMLNESNTNTTIPGDVFLTYRNQKYGIKMQYSYFWSIDGNSYPAGKIGIQVVSFFLPSGGSDLPIVSIGTDNLSKSFNLPVHLDEYLRLSLEYKNSTGFPGFKLIQSNVNYNASSNNSTRSLFGGNVYTIIWSYNHPTYGMRKSIELGTIVGGNKGFFIDYTTSARKFLKYLPTK